MNLNLTFEDIIKKKFSYIFFYKFENFEKSVWA